MFFAALAAVLAFTPSLRAEDEEGFVSLFNGKDLSGWKVNENTDSVRVEDGAIVLNGPRAHAFYVGDVEDHDFKNFVLKLDIMTMPKANAGVYFHTKYQDSGWPSAGYEAQVNATHGDAKKGGGLYAVKDITESPVGDNEWWTYTIRVEGKKITLMVNDKTTVEYTEPDDVERPAAMSGRKLSSGTFALQAHDPISKVLVRNIRVKPLD